MNVDILTDEKAIARAEQLVEGGQRRVLGIAGAPGSGKSTLACRIVAALRPRAAYLPMDGFHLANEELQRLGLRSVKGAVETFDGAGFLSLLRRARSEEDTVYAPRFDRTMEEPVAGSIAIRPEARLIVTEGNYLLNEQYPWSAVAGECDETWYLDVSEEIRIHRLIDRHMRFGMDRDAAERWARGTDQRNAELIAVSRWRADHLVRIDHAVAQSAGSTA